MKVQVHRDRLHFDLNGLGLLVDIVMVALVTANLSLILFDWFWQIDAIQHLMQRQTPAFHAFYQERIHANFLSIDLAFVSVYLTEFVISWGVAIARRTYHRWFFYPFVHWYDLLGCIPVGSFRWLRILRLVSLLYRLQRLGVLDFSQTAFGQTLIKYYDVLAEEISDRVVIKVLQGVQREVHAGGPLVRRIEEQVLAPRRKPLVDYLAGRIVEMARSSHGQYRDALSEYLVHVSDEAVRRTAAGRRLASMPVAGPRAIALLGDTVRDAGTAIVDQIVSDITAPAHRERLDALIDDLLSTSQGGRHQINDLMRDTLLEILDHVQQQVAVQHWKEQEKRETERERPVDAR